MAAKKHYFGVGGGTRRFLSVAEKDGKFGSKNIVIVILFMLDCSPKKDCRIMLQNKRHIKIQDLYL